MKLIIAGGRDFTDYSLLSDIMSTYSISPREIVCGKARGADTLGEQWAIENNIYVRYFPADWDNLGRKAGYIRNMEMGKYGTALLAFWDGESKGTKHMIDIMKKLGKSYAVIGYDGDVIEWNIGEKE